MQYYRSSRRLLPKSQYAAVKRLAENITATYVKNPRRQPYIRSAYFNGDKVFLTHFWTHVLHKNQHDRIRRLRLLDAGLDLILHSTYSPNLKPEAVQSNILRYRFFGETIEGIRYIVQIKQQSSQGKKLLISIFPESNH